MGQQRIEEAKVRAYRETGRLIDQHLLVHKDRAQYGADTMARLAADAGISPRVLYHCVEFARAFRILTARSELTWVHYRALTQVEDQAQRKAFEAQSVRHNWNSRELEERVRPLALPNGAPVAPSNVSVPGLKPLALKRGTVGVYRIETGRGSLAVDLGFTLEQHPPGKRSRGSQGQLCAGGLGTGDSLG